MGVGVTHPYPTPTCGEPTPLPRIRSIPLTPYIPTEHPPLSFQTQDPGGIYIFRKGIANVRVCV